jgi:hypothetical protein
MIRGPEMGKKSLEFERRTHVFTLYFCRKPLISMKHLDFEILKLKFENFEKKYWGSEMSRGQNEFGPK